MKLCFGMTAFFFVSFVRFACKGLTGKSNICNILIRNFREQFHLSWEFRYTLENSADQEAGQFSFENKIQQVG